MSEYMLTPNAVAAPFEPVVVALAANTTKTVLQVGVPSTTDIRVLGWGVSFDAAAAGQPGWAQLADTDTAATVTTMTAYSWGNPLAPASLCVGGTALSGYNASAEGTVGAIVVRDPQEIYPQAGYSVYFPEPRVQPRIAPSRFLRIRVKMPAVVNCIPWILWTEPAI